MIKSYMKEHSAIMIVILHAFTTTAFGLFLHFLFPGIGDQLFFLLGLFVFYIVITILSIAILEFREKPGLEETI